MKTALACLGFVSGLTSLLAAAAEPGAAPQTTLGAPDLQFSRPLKPYVVLARGDIEIVVVDNSAVDDAVLPGHKAGYHGIAALRHAAARRNLFVPQFSGLNFEHIHDGTAQPRELLFEPRHAPIELRVVNEQTVELYQPATPHWGLESCMRYTLQEEGTIDFTFACIPRRNAYKNGYIGLFWASYIDQPESLDIHFLGADHRAPSQRRLVRGKTPAHGVDATHKALGDERPLAHDAKFPLTLVFSLSPWRYLEPWYVGKCRGMAYTQMFRREDGVRFSQSPNGAGNGNPAWDFQWFITNVKVNRLYQMNMRVLYAPLDDDVERLAEAGHTLRQRIERAARFDPPAN